MNAPKVLLPLLFTLPGCGVLSYTDNKVSAEAINAHHEEPRLQTKVEFVPDYAVDKLHNKLLYAWSPVVVFENGKEFKLRLILHSDLSLSESSIKLSSVRIVTPDGARQSIEMSKSGQWISLKSAPIGYKSNDYFPIPEKDGCLLEVDFLLSKSRGSPEQINRRWRLIQTRVTETGVGFKSA